MGKAVRTGLSEIAKEKHGTFGKGDGITELFH